MLASWKGCEVFENIGCTGKTDIVLIHPTLGHVQIDVKCANWRTDDTINGRWNVNTAKVQRPVYAVIVKPEGDFADWKVSWKNIGKGRHSEKTLKWDCPIGWEDFWSNDNRIYTTTSTKHTDEDQATD